MSALLDRTGLLSVLVAAAVIGCAPSAEEICKRQETLALEDADRLIGKHATDAQKKLVEDGKADIQKNERDCEMTFRKIQEVTPASKWRAFAKCMQAAPSLSDQKACPDKLE